MEHAVYICEWARSDDDWTIWVKARPHIRAQGITYAEAESGLLTAIQDAGGAMHAVMEFVTPLPKTHLETDFAQPELYLITGDDSFETDSPIETAFELPESREERFRWSDAFYSEPVCRDCWTTHGRRNDRPLPLRHTSQYDGAIGFIGTCRNEHQIVSAAFLELLTEKEIRSLELQPVARKRSRKKFFEVVGPTGPRPVGVDGLNATGWYCQTCGHRTWGYWVEGCSITHFVARQEIAAQSLGVFTVGDATQIRLVATAERWRQLVGKQGTRGFTSSLLGIVGEDRVVRAPEVPPLRRDLPNNPTVPFVGS